MRTQSERSANAERTQCERRMYIKSVLQNSSYFFFQPFLMSSKHLQCPFGVQGNLHDEARRAEFDGMGWDGMGRVRNQKCPLKFFILCGYIDYIYNIYIYSKGG